MTVLKVTRVADSKPMFIPGRSILHWEHAPDTTERQDAACTQLVLNGASASRVVVVFGTPASIARKLGHDVEEIPAGDE